MTQSDSKPHSGGKLIAAQPKRPYNNEYVDTATKEWHRIFFVSELEAVSDDGMKINKKLWYDSCRTDFMRR